MKDKKVLIFLFLILLSNLIFLSKLVFSNYSLFQRDLMLQFKPWKTFINSSLKNIFFSSDYLDFIPLWNPYNHCGTPFIGNVQTQIFYPLSIIFYLIENFVVAFKIFLFIHLMLAGIFMFLMLKNKGFGSIASLSGALVWSFNGYIVSRMEFLSVFSSVIWLPLMVLLIDKLSKHSSLKNSIYISFCAAVQFLAGHTQIWFYSILFCLFYCLFLSILNRNIKILYMFFLGLLLSVVISSIQFLPTLEFVLHSTRTGFNFDFKKFGMEFKDSVMFSLKLTDIINFLYPFNWQISFKPINDLKVFDLPNYWIFTFYTGFFSVFLSIASFFSKRYLKEKIFLSIVFILFLFYALGENSLFYGFVYKIFPLIRLFRYPATSILIGVFIVCLFLCYGIDAISQFVYSKTNLEKILILIPILIFLELKYYSEKIILTLPSEILYEKSEIINFLLNLKDIDDYRIALTPKTQILARTVFGDNLYEAFKNYRDRLLGNINLDYSIYNFRGQDIELKNFYNFLDMVYSSKSLKEAIPFFSISNVKYILSSELQNVENCKLIFNSKNMKIYENPSALRKIYFVNQYIIEPDLENSKLLFQNMKENLKDIAIIHTKDNSISIKTNNNVNKNIYKIKNIQFRSNKIFLEIENSSDGFLVISQNFYPGWICYVNRTLEKIHHCNIFMMCIPLKSGKNEVFLKFEPLSFKIGTILSLIMTLFCFLYLFEKEGGLYNERV